MERSLALGGGSRCARSRGAVCGFDRDRCIAWAREQFAATAPFATGGSYSNFMPDDGEDPVAAAYGANAGRLAEIKARFDPDNLFRMNHNVRPRS